jgi:predicted dehydrogenase
MVLLSYPDFSKAGFPVRTVANPYASARATGAVNLALVGAGGFAKGMHLPNLKAMREQFHLRAVMSRTGHNASATARQFGADYATTEWTKVIGDKDVEAVLIATRHNLHASLTLDALKAGKHVLVEKPLALTGPELNALEEFYSGGEGKGKPVLLTGFNRRFSKYAAEVKRRVEARSNPLVIQYRMNAGYIPLDHWVHTEEGGGRNLGEACHLYDLFTYLTGARVATVDAKAFRPATDHYSRRDNFSVTLTFEDGSLATLLYTALGDPGFPKERLEVFFDGKVLVVDDYRRLEAHGIRVPKLESAVPEKGQKEELEAFAQVLRKGGEWPIPLWQQLQASRIALQVETQI